MATIKSTNVIIPEVLVDLIQFDYENSLVLAQLCQVNTDLEGKPGEKVTIPYTAPLNDAEDVAEGDALTPEANNDGTIEVTIGKSGKAVEMTEEAINRAAYNLADERRTQIAATIARKVDSKVNDMFKTTSKKHDITSESVTTLSYNAIVDAQTMMGEEFYTRKPVLVVHSKQMADLRKTDEFKSGIIVPGYENIRGLAGMLVDVPVLVSDRITKDASENYHALLVVPGAGVLAYKKRPNIKYAEDILSEKQIMASFVHYGTKLPNANRGVVEIITK